MAEQGMVQSVERAFEILEIMAAAGEDLGISEIAEQAGLPQPTIHRLLRTMAAHGYVYQTPRRRYAPGTRLIPLSEGAGGSLATTLLPALRPLVAQINESANVAMLDHNSARYVAHLAGDQSMRMFTSVGRKAELHATAVGKAILSKLPEDRVRAILESTKLPSVTPKTITDLDLLMEEIRVTRRRGYALDDEEQELGVNCVAVAVPSTLKLAVSLSGPLSRMTLRTIGRAVPLLQQSAVQIAELIRNHGD